MSINLITNYSIFFLRMLEGLELIIQAGIELDNYPRILKTREKDSIYFSVDMLII